MCGVGQAENTFLPKKTTGTVFPKNGQYVFQMPGGKATGNNRTANTSSSTISAILRRELCVAVAASQ
jgi:hypothetical protein